MKEFTPIEILISANKEYKIAEEKARWSGETNGKGQVYLFGREDGKTKIRVRESSEQYSEVLVDKYQANIIIEGLKYIYGY